MLLVIDVGNTQTAIGVYEGESLDCMWRVATNRDHTADELRVKLLPLLQSENLQASDITGAALASVVPQLTGAWTRAVQDLAGVRAVVCSAKTAGSLFDADYPNPREIGSDRVADAVAARELFGSPVIVVDFGTATNIEVVDKQGRFLGGIIAPGVQTGAAALFSHATRLAAIDLIDPHHAIGRKVGKHPRGLGRLERDDHVGGAFRNERSNHFLPVIAHTNMRDHAAAALGHTDRLGSANLPSLCLGRLRENLRGENRSLPANAGQKHVTHGAPPSPPRFPAARSP